MSAGTFERTLYELDDGSIAPIRVQPETLAAEFDGAANAAAAGPATTSCFAKVSKSRRAYGIGPRTVSAEWTAAPPTDYDDRGSLRIPIMQASVYDGITIFSTGTYLGAGITVIGKSGENVK